MLLRLILLMGLLLGAYFLFRRLRRLAWTQRVRRIAAAIGIGSVLLLLTIRGGAEIALPLLTVLAPFLLRWLNTSLPSPASVSPSRAGAKSEVTTRFLRMSLDHATGVMTGVVQTGGFVGRLLSNLTDSDLLILWQECQIDPESVAVLEAYLDRQGDPDWRARFQQAGSKDSAGPASHDKTMSRAEAYEMLGLLPGASRKEIQTAYRRLMQRLHPDHGGSAYLAARLNQARQVLLQEDR